MKNTDLETFAHHIAELSERLKDKTPLESMLAGYMLAKNCKGKEDIKNNIRVNS